MTDLTIAERDNELFDGEGVQSIGLPFNDADSDEFAEISYVVVKWLAHSKILITRAWNHGSDETCFCTFFFPCEEELVFEDYMHTRVAHHWNSLTFHKKFELLRDKTVEA